MNTARKLTPSPIKWTATRMAPHTRPMRRPTPSRESAPAPLTLRAVPTARTKGGPRRRSCPIGTRLKTISRASKDSTMPTSARNRETIPAMRPALRACRPMVRSVRTIPTSLGLGLGEALAEDAGGAEDQNKDQYDKHQQVLELVGGGG